MINGLESRRDTGGALFVDGENIRDKDMIALRRSIGYAIQGASFFNRRRQNIAYIAEPAQ